jgi:probable F420-dependent oxidoreductase
LRVGLCLPQLGAGISASAVRDFCQQAEELGFASLWVQEHLFYPLGNASGYAGRADTRVHDAYRSVLSATQLLAFTAGCTSRVTIGTSVLVGGYHRPVELAQTLATLDVLSGGRLIVGLSVGWSVEEHVQMDVDPRTRGKRLDELVQALEVCWGPDPVEFQGEFFSIPASVIGPKPLQAPRPALLSGMRSPAGLERTARYFDIWNPTRGSARELREQLDHMATMRPKDMPPLRLFYRSYTQRPTDPIGVHAGDGVERVLQDAHVARDAGAEELIIDANFDDLVAGDPTVWASIPQRLSRVVEAAAG